MDSYLAAIESGDTPQILRTISRYCMQELLLVLCIETISRSIHSTYINFIIL